VSVRGRTILNASALLLSILALTCSAVSSQTLGEDPSSLSLKNFEVESRSCRAKGRIQDSEYCQSKIVNRIVAHGKDAVPILISQLTDTSQLKAPVFDYWHSMAVGDLAYFFLMDLFTDADWSTFNMPGIETFNDQCNLGAEDCWHRFLKKHSRRSIQREWTAAWKAHKNLMGWDPKARCFRETNVDTSAPPQITPRDGSR
jgi:hypothetical protein